MHLHDEGHDSAHFSAKCQATFRLFPAPDSIIMAGKPVQAIDCQQFTVLQILGITGFQPPYGF
jgi:hypothetical protein